MHGNSLFALFFGVYVYDKNGEIIFLLDIIYFKCIENDKCVCYNLVLKIKYFRRVRSVGFNCIL